MISPTDIDISHLRSFVAVAEAGGFTAAADRLNLTQSGISLRLRKLEERLGVRLILRTSRRFELTAEGEILLGYARRLLELNDEVVSRLRDPDVNGRLRVGLADYLAPLSLGRILDRLRRHYPNLRLEVVTGLGDDLGPLYERGELDLIIAGANESLGKGRPLFREKLVWAGKNRISAEGQTPVDLVSLPGSCVFRQSAIQRLDEMGTAWRINLTANSISGVHEGLRAGLGIAVLPVCAVPEDMIILDDSRLPLLPPHQVVAFIRKNVGAVGERFISFLTDELLKESAIRNVA